MSAWTELACLLASIFLVSSIGVCLKCFPLLVCQCLSSGPLGFLLKRDNRSLSKLLPSVSEQSYSKGTEVFLPIWINVCPKCFPTSVTNLSEGITWCLPGSAQCLPSQCLSDGFDQCLPELVLTCFFLPMSVRRNLLMSIWCLSNLLPSVSEQPCLKGLRSFCPSWFSPFLSANICWEEPADVCLDWTRVFSCQCLSSEFNRCLPEVFPTACLSVSF